MSKSTETKYYCERCHKQLATCHNNIEIVTPLNKTTHWSRLYLTITHQYGIHNDATTEDADLCKACAVFLLKDALKRVQAGERLTAGVEHSEQSLWEEK